MSADAAENRLYAYLEALPCNLPWKERSDLERTILLIYWLELDVANGGLEQYFVNPAGDKWNETLSALRRVEANEIVKIFELALKVFPDASPSTDQSERSQQLLHAGSVARETLNRLDDRYFELYRQFPDEDSYAKMAQFLQRMVKVGNADNSR